MPGQLEYAYDMRGWHCGCRRSIRVHDLRCRHLPAVQRSIGVHHLLGWLLLYGRCRHIDVCVWLVRRVGGTHVCKRVHHLPSTVVMHGWHCDRMRCWLLSAVDWAVHLYHLSNRFLLYQWCRCDQLPSWYLWRRHWPDRIRIVYHLPDHAVLYRRHCGPRMRCWHIWCRCWPHLGERVYHLPGWFVVQCRCGDCVYRWHIPAGDWTVDLHYLHDWFLLHGRYSDRIVRVRLLRRSVRSRLCWRVHYVPSTVGLYRWREHYGMCCRFLPATHRSVYLYHVSARIVLYRRRGCHLMPGWNLRCDHWPHCTRVVHDVPADAVLSRRYVASGLCGRHLWSHHWPHIGECLYDVPSRLVV